MSIRPANPLPVCGLFGYFYQIFPLYEPINVDVITSFEKKQTKLAEIIDNNLHFLD